MTERDDPKTRVNRLFRHGQDQSQQIRLFCIQHLELIGLDSLLATLDRNEINCGMNGLMRGLSENTETSSFRLLLNWIRNRIETRAREQEKNLLHLTTPEFHQLLAEVIFEISGGENWSLWKTFLAKHYSLLLVTNSNYSTVCPKKHTTENSLPSTRIHCLVASRRRISTEGLPSIINPPLETCQGTNHQNTSSQTVPASLPAQKLHSLHHRNLLS